MRTEGRAISAPEQGRLAEIKRRASQPLIPLPVAPTTMLRQVHADRDWLIGEVDRLRNALSGHLFDGESLSTREAIRSELIVQGFQAEAELNELRVEVERLRAQIGGAE